MSSSIGHRWLGHRRSLSLLALTYLALVLVLMTIAAIPTWTSVDGELGLTFDSLSTLTIVLITLTVYLGAIAYAIVNRGPVLAFAIPIVPIAYGNILATRYVLDLDGAIALTTAALGCTLAYTLDAYFRHGTLRPWIGRTETNDLFAMTTLVIIAAVGLTRFILNAPTHVVEWYAPMHAVWLPIGVLLALGWIGFFVSIRREIGYPSVES